MLSKTIVNNFISGLFALRTSLTFEKKCYIGLLYTAPTDDNLVGEEVSGHDYERVKIGEMVDSDGDGTYLINSHYKFMVNQDLDGNTLDREFRNQWTIYFPEAYGGAWATADKPVTHFGLYNDITGGSPYMWGRLQDENGNPKDVIIPEFSIPIFRKGDLRVSLKDEETTA